MGLLRSAVGAGVLVAGVGVAWVGRWLLGPTDQEDDPDPDPCEAGTCTHQWLTCTEDGGDNVHVVPIRDEVAHTYTDDCVCGPAVEAVFRPDGSNGWLHTHHQLLRKDSE